MILRLPLLFSFGLLSLLHSSLVCLLFAFCSTILFYQFVAHVIITYAIPCHRCLVAVASFHATVHIKVIARLPPQTESFSHISLCFVIVCLFVMVTYACLFVERLHCCHRHYHAICCCQFFARLTHHIHITRSSFVFPFHMPVAICLLPVAACHRDGHCQATSCCLPRIRLTCLFQLFQGSGCWPVTVMKAKSGCRGLGWPGHAWPHTHSWLPAGLSSSRAEGQASC